MTHAACAEHQTTELFFPVLRAESIYRDEAAKALEAICTPLRGAKSGDVLAIRLNFRCREVTMLRPAADIVLMDGAAPAIVRFTDAPTSVRNRIAAHVLDFQAYGMSTVLRREMGKRFNPDRIKDATVTATMTPQAALFHAPFDKTVIANGFLGPTSLGLSRSRQKDCAGENVTQALVNGSMGVVLQDWRTSHELILRIPAIDDALDIFRAVAPVIGWFKDDPHHAHNLARPEIGDAPLM